MKKRILGLALIAMSMAAIGANAQTNSNCPNDNSNCTKTECTRSQKCGKGDAYKLRSNAVFDKMNLSADQKAKLQALKQKKAEARRLPPRLERLRSSEATPRPALHAKLKRNNTFKT